MMRFTSAWARSSDRPSVIAATDFHTRTRVLGPLATRTPVAAGGGAEQARTYLSNQDYKESILSTLTARSLAAGAAYVDELIAGGMLQTQGD
jgi:hypothetical protein